MELAVQVHKFGEVPAQEYYLPAEKLVVGNPKQTVWIQYTDPSKKFVAGVWQSEVGKWSISYTEEEYCHLLEGTSIIADASGNSVTVSAGDSCVIPRGFTGTWEVVAPTRKTFAIYEPGG